MVALSSSRWMVSRTRDGARIERRSRVAVEITARGQRPGRHQDQNQKARDQRAPMHAVALDVNTLPCPAQQNGGAGRRDGPRQQGRSPEALPINR